MPARSVALDQRDRARRTPASRGVILRRHIDRRPGVADRIDPLPLRLDLIAAHEQGLVALDEIEQQPLISDAAALAGEAVRERDVHRHFLELHAVAVEPGLLRSEEQTSELQSLMRISYAVFCLKKKR